MFNTKVERDKDGKITKIVTELPEYVKPIFEEVKDKLKTLSSQSAYVAPLITSSFCQSASSCAC